MNKIFEDHLYTSTAGLFYPKRQQVSVAPLLSSILGYSFFRKNENGLLVEETGGLRGALEGPAPSSQSQADNLPFPEWRSPSWSCSITSPCSMNGEGDLPESIRAGQRWTTMTSGRGYHFLAGSIYDFKQYGQSVPG